MEIILVICFVSLTRFMLLFIGLELFMTDHAMDDSDVKFLEEGKHFTSVSEDWLLKPSTCRCGYDAGIKDLRQQDCKLDHFSNIWLSFLGVEFESQDLYESV